MMQSHVNDRFVHKIPPTARIQGNDREREVQGKARVCGHYGVFHLILEKRFGGPFGGFYSHRHVVPTKHV